MGYLYDLYSGVSKAFIRQQVPRNNVKRNWKGMDNSKVLTTGASVKKRVKKRVQSEIVQSAAIVHLEENTASASEADRKAYNDLFDSIYRDLFEQIHVRSDDQLRDPRPKEEHELEVNAELGERFTEIFKSFTSSVIEDRVKEDDITAFSVLKATIWFYTQMNEDHIGHIERNFFHHHVPIKAKLSTAVLYGKISPQLKYETIQVLLRQWQRYHQTAEKLGWKMLSILSFSISFRQEALIVNDTDWNKFFLKLSNLKTSFELVGDFYCPKWRSLLESVTPENASILCPKSQDYHGHHNLWVVSLANGALAAQPAAPFEVLEKSIPGVGINFAADPRIIEQPAQISDVPGAYCPICMEAKNSCTCPTHIWFPCRVECIQTENRGVGIRTLQGIKNGQIIGEYVGELTFSEKVLHAHDLYLLSGYKMMYQVTSKVKGNWTRFVNHACQSNCSIYHHYWRGKTYAMYKANRDIETFEELTVNYGKVYFSGKNLKTCLCSEKIHITDPDYVRLEE